MIYKSLVFISTLALFQVTSATSISVSVSAPGPNPFTYRACSSFSDPMNSHDFTCSNCSNWVSSGTVNSSQSSPTKQTQGCLGIQVQAQNWQTTDTFSIDSSCRINGLAWAYPPNVMPGNLSPITFSLQDGAIKYPNFSIAINISLDSSSENERRFSVSCTMSPSSPPSN